METLDTIVQFKGRSHTYALASLAVPESSCSHREHVGIFAVLLFATGRRGSETWAGGAGFPAPRRALRMALFGPPGGGKTRDAVLEQIADLEATVRTRWY